MFVEITADGVKAIADAKDAKFRVQEKTSLWGMDALILDVVACGADEYYFVENEWDINDNEDYNTAKYECKVGAYVKMHAPLKGEQLIMTVSEDVFAAVAEGDMVVPAAGGAVAKA